MVRFAAKSGHYISTDSQNRYLSKWRFRSAYRGLCRVFLPALNVALLSACSMSDERYASATLSNSTSMRRSETGFQVPPIAPASLKTDDRRRSVAFETVERAGTVVVDIAAGSLYLVTGEGRAMRYRIEPLAPKGEATPRQHPENWVERAQQPAFGSMIKMRNPRDAEDLHQRMSAGGKVVFLSSSK